MAERTSEPSEGSQSGPGMVAFARQLLHLLSANKRGSLLVLGTIAVQLAYDLAFPLCLQIIFDRAIVQHDGRLLARIMAGIAAALAVVTVANLLEDRLAARISARVLHGLRQSLLARLLGLGTGWFQRADAGDLLSRFSNDLTSVETFLVQGLRMVLYCALLAVASAVLLFIVDWRLALVVCVVAPTALLAPELIGPRTQTSNQIRKQDEGRALSLVQESIAGQATIQAFGLEGPVLGRFEGRSRALETSSAWSSYLSSVMGRATVLATTVLIVCILGAGAFLAVRGHLSTGALLAFVGLLLNLQAAAQMLSGAIPQGTKALVSLRRVQEVLEAEPEVQEMGGATDLPRLGEGPGLESPDLAHAGEPASAGTQRPEELRALAPHAADVPDAAPLGRLCHGIAFRQVSFGYAADRPVLRDVDLIIPSGQAVAFVGPSGSGKSTILNLMMRVYDPDLGSILFDGRDLRQATQASLRAQIGVVFQESFLFNISIGENIRLGRPQATDSEVEQAARAAEIHDFIGALPEGYGTLAGDRGGRFSGGQRQRLALARAILRQPAILVLDEATSALDPATEASITATLRRLREGRTVVSVTHRLSTVIDMDRIFVLAQGRVVEQGTHKQLLNLKGTYFGMWQQFALTMTQDALVGDLGHAEAQPVTAQTPRTEDAVHGLDDLREDLRRQSQEVLRLQAINQRWAQLAGTDRLTDLPNKLSYLQAMLPHEIQQAQRRGDPLGFLLISGDALGLINENRGRDAGDEVLRALARFLQTVLRGEELLGHLDGTNFAVALHPADRERARQRAEDLRRQVEAHPFPCRGSQVHISISAGVTSVDSAAITDPREGIEGVFRQLNQALYQAKRAGGNRVEVL